MSGYVVSISIDNGKKESISADTQDAALGAVQARLRTINKQIRQIRLSIVLSLVATMAGLPLVYWAFHLKGATQGIVMSGFIIAAYVLEFRIVLYREYGNGVLHILRHLDLLRERRDKWELEYSIQTSPDNRSSPS